MDADALERRPGGAGHRQGQVPRSRSGVRRRRGPLFGPRRARADRRRLRTARGCRRCADCVGAGSSGHPRRSRRQDEQPLLRLGNRQRGGHCCGLRQGGRGHQARDGLPTRASRADGNLRLRRRFRPHRHETHAVVDEPGAARAPHPVRAGRGASRTEDPRHLSGHRRRVRQQGADLSGLRLLDRRVDADRQAGEMDGRPVREPHQHGVRPRLRYAGRNGSDQGRQDPGHPHRRSGRPRRFQRHRRPGEPLPGSSACSPAATTSRPPIVI